MGYKKYYYDTDGELYIEPLPTWFNIEEATLVTTPIRPDGRLYLRHEGVADLQKDENGEPYEFYGTDGLPDMARVTEALDKSRSGKAALEGLTYPGTDKVIRFTREAAAEIALAKTALEQGLNSVHMVFDNGSRLEVTADTFPDFLEWFITERNEMFKPSPIPPVPGA